MTQAYNLSQFANFLNSSGQVSASGIQSGVTLPSGTVSLYYQASAPTGWTQVTSLNDYDLRLVSSSGGTTGGTTAYSTVFTNQTISAPTIGATTLTTAQIPSHQHLEGMGIYPSGSGFQYGEVTGTYPVIVNSTATEFNGLYSSSGAGLPYTQAIGSGGSHTHTATGGATITLNVRYANIILCSKN